MLHLSGILYKSLMQHAQKAKMQRYQQNMVVTIGCSTFMETACKLDRYKLAVAARNSHYNV